MPTEDVPWGVHQQVVRARPVVGIPEGARREGPEERAAPVVEGRKIADRPVADPREGHVGFSSCPREVIRTEEDPRRPVRVPGRQVHGERQHAGARRDAVEEPADVPELFALGTAHLDDRVGDAHQVAREDSDER